MKYMRRDGRGNAKKLCDFISIVGLGQGVGRTDMH